MQANPNLFLDQIGDSRWIVRQIALVHLVAGGQDLIPQLLELILRSDAVSSGRATAIQALGKMNDPSIVNVLMQVIDDPDSYVRESVALAFGDLRDKRGIESLLRMLSSDVAETAREAAAWSLRKFPETRVIEALVTALGLGDDWFFVRERAAEALVEIGAATLPFVMHGLQAEDERIRNECNWILHELEESSIVPGAHWDRLNSEDFETRFQTVTHLWNLDTPAMIPGLAIAFKDRDYRVRLTALLAANRLRTPAALQLVQSATTDPHELVQATAKRFIGQT